MWSFAGDDERADISQFQLQPLASYRVSPANTIGYLGTTTANWKADSGERWTVPLGLSYSILTRPAGGAGQLHHWRRLQRRAARECRRLVPALPSESCFSEMRSAA
jgi:hypothetical protein